VEAVGKEDELAATKAVKRIPTHITNIFHCANFAAHGQDIRFRLDKLREAMQRDMLLIKNAESMLEQMLDDPHFWDVEFLAKMVDDPDYNFMVVSKAKELLNE
jgi:hypothetical protein